jgi:hypothetical protein
VRCEVHGLSFSVPCSTVSPPPLHHFTLHTTPQHDHHITFPSPGGSTCFDSCQTLHPRPRGIARLTCGDVTARVERKGGDAGLGYLRGQAERALPIRCCWMVRMKEVHGSLEMMRAAATALRLGLGGRRRLVGCSKRYGITMGNAAREWREALDRPGAASGSF